MKAIERLYQYFDFKGIKPTRFEKDFGFGNGYFGKQLARKADIGSSILETIIDKCPDINVEWLINGKGNMLIVYSKTSPRSIEEPQSGCADPPCERCKMKDELIESLRQQVDTQSKLINYLEENKSPIEEGQKRKVV